jgi:hypothetical protein
MGKPLSSDEGKAYVDELEKSVSREECGSCDCLQGSLTRLELDCLQAADEVGRLKVPRGEMHGCLGCEPCPPAALFAEYIRRRNQPPGSCGSESKP